MDKFIGRSNVVKELNLLKKKKKASLVVIKGRRRIGKSCLALEISRGFAQVLSFTGLPPRELVNAERQRNEFIRQLREQRIPSMGSQDWGDLFHDVAQRGVSGEVLVILDEITWMGSADPDFLGKLKIAWDQYFKLNPNLILIISGSNSAWIEKNILSKTGFFGRVSYRLTLDELALAPCAEFWGDMRENISAYEMLKVLSVTGGVPRYLEEIMPEQTAEKNIFNLCYLPQGILFNEFDDIFSDLFQRRGERYKSIVHAIADGNKTVETISTALGRDKGGDISNALDELCNDGFLSRDFSWQIKTMRKSKLSQYRIKDNYLRFYLKYILPHRHKVEVGAMSRLPSGWDSIIGIQFENLVINNRRKLIEVLGIDGNEVEMSNPYYQNQTNRQGKCQIDYMIQTQFNNLYVCEIKFHKSALGKDVISEVQDKIAQLQVPRGYSVRPVLIHVNGVKDSVLAENYFAQIVDFSEFLDK